MKKAWIMAFLFLLIAPQRALAEPGRWSFESRYLPQASERVKIAWVENEAGYRFSVVGLSSGRIQAVFQLPENQPVAMGTVQPSYRIDGGPSRPVNAWGMFAEISPKSARWFIWDGNGRPCEAPDDRWKQRALCEIMDGETLEFSLYLLSGELHRTRFSLAESRKAIASVIGSVED